MKNGWSRAIEEEEEEEEEQEEEEEEEEEEEKLLLLRSSFFLLLLLFFSSSPVIPISYIVSLFPIFIIRVFSETKQRGKFRFVVCGVPLSPCMLSLGFLAFLPSFLVSFLS